MIGHVIIALKFFAWKFSKYLNIYPFLLTSSGGVVDCMSCL